MWNRISRSAPGRITPVISRTGECSAQLSVNSARKKIAPSSRKRSSAASNGVGTVIDWPSVNPSDLVREVPRPGQVHGDPGLLGGLDHLFVADRSAGLHDRLDPGVGEHLQA